MSPETSQDIFFEWLNAALQDSQWRPFIAARLRESELPVINLDTKPGTPGKLRRTPSAQKTLDIGRDPERRVIAFTE